MKRRLLLGVAGVASMPRLIRAQQTPRVATIGILATGNQLSSPTVERFRRELLSLGYIEGRNLTLVFRTTVGGDPGSVGALAAELVRLPVDIIVTDGAPAVSAAKQATTTIPIVMAVIIDPVGLGLVQSYARPGGNITGFSILAEELGVKRLEILKEVVPGMKRLGMLFNSANPGNAKLQIDPIAEAAAKIAIDIESVGATNRTEIAAAFDVFKERQVSAVMSVAEALLFAERKYIAGLAVAARLPGMFPDRLFAPAGGLLAYGPDVVDLFGRAAGYVDRILKGAKPADLPVERPTHFELVINLKTAKALGVVVPQTLLARADELIE